MEQQAEAKKPNDETTEKASSKNKRKLWPVIVLPLFFVSAIGFGIYYFVKIQNPLEGILATDLESVTVIAAGADSSDNEFPVHPQRWTKTLQNFNSTVVNWSPSKWSVVASIRFKLKDNREFLVTVFDTRSKLGCFRIGDVYYTGGSKAYIDRVLSDGFKKIGVKR